MPRPALHPYRAEERAFILDPHVDYGRVLTEGGGIGFFFKDIDTRFRHTFNRFALFGIAGAAELWFVLTHSPTPSPIWNTLTLLAALAVNAYIVAKPVELYRTIEIRYDCMIIERTEVFYNAYMHMTWPAFRFDQRRGRSVMTGVYGTRMVEFLDIQHADESDRAPEVLAHEVQLAMQQLWGSPQR